MLESFGIELVGVSRWESLEQIWILKETVMNFELSFD